MPLTQMPSNTKNKGSLSARYGAFLCLLSIAVNFFPQSSFGSAEPEILDDGVLQLSGVEYGARPLQTMDLYYRDEYREVEGGVPMVFMVHGGGPIVMGGDEDRAGFLEQRKIYTDMGYLVAAMDYSYVTKSDSSADVACSIAYMMEHAEEYGADADNFGIHAFSYGNAVAQHVAYNDDIDFLDFGTLEACETSITMEEVRGGLKAYLSESGNYNGNDPESYRFMVDDDYLFQGNAEHLAAIDYEDPFPPIHNVEPQDGMINHLDAEDPAYFAVYTDDSYYDPNRWEDLYAEMDAADLTYDHYYESGLPHSLNLEIPERSHIAEKIQKFMTKNLEYANRSYTNITFASSPFSRTEEVPNGSNAIGAPCIEINNPKNFPVVLHELEVNVGQYMEEVAIYQPSNTSEALRISESIIPDMSGNIIFPIDFFIKAKGKRNVCLGMSAKSDYYGAFDVNFNSAQVLDSHGNIIAINGLPHTIAGFNIIKKYSKANSISLLNPGGTILASDELQRDVQFGSFCLNVPTGRYRINDVILKVKNEGEAEIRQVYLANGSRNSRFLRPDENGIMYFKYPMQAAVFSNDPLCLKIVGNIMGGSPGDEIIFSIESKLDLRIQDLDQGNYIRTSMNEMYDEEEAIRFILE